MRHRLTIDYAAAPMLAIVTLFATSALSRDVGTDAQNERCRVAPGTDATQGTLTEKLDECGGVLKPPRVGDTEMVEPAPDVGRTPVIRPGELPRQQ
nr:hypothetical protein [Sinorhizobium fredii]